MPESDVARGDGAVKWLLETMAAGFVAEAAAVVMHHELVAAAIALMVGGALSWLGFSWANIRPALHARLARTAADVATDFKWWLLVLGMMFIYAGFPVAWNSLRPPAAVLGSLPTRHDASVSEPSVLTSPDAPPSVTAISSGALHDMTNDELRAAAYQMADELSKLHDFYLSTDAGIRYDKSIDEAARAKKEISLDAEVNRTIRNAARDPGLNMMAELLSRLKYKPTSREERVSNTLNGTAAIDREILDSLSWDLVGLAKALP